MSGPVRILTMGGVRPYCIAFAGAEFVVREKTRIGNDEFWVVHVEVCMCEPPPPAVRLVGFVEGGFLFVCRSCTWYAFAMFSYDQLFVLIDLR